MEQTHRGEGEDGGRVRVEGGVKTASSPALFDGKSLFWRKHVSHLVAEEAGGGGDAGGCDEEEQVEGVHSQLGGGGGRRSHYS